MVVVALQDVIGQKDSLLIARHRAGDPMAFEKLYDTHYAMLLRFVQRRVRQHEAVEDIAQEAFVRAFAAIDGLHETNRFYPWLTMIARRLIIDHYRFHGRLTVVEDLDPGWTDGPEIDLLERQEHADLAEALQRVRGRHREVLHLRETEELSYEQIAERLGVPTTTVPPLLHRARLALRREFLALTEHERTGVFLPVIFLITDAARRARDRVLHMAAYLPDPQALTGSFAAVALGVSGVWGVTPAGADSPREPVLMEEVNSVTLDGLGDIAPSLTSPVADDPFADTAGTSGSVEAPVVIFEKTHTQRAVDEDRNRDHHIQYQDHSVSVDVDGMRDAVESSLAGNYGWLEE